MSKYAVLSLIFVAIVTEASAQKLTREQKEKQKKEQLAKEKPGVLVVGNGEAAATAAIQAATSGVNTTILLQAGGFDIVGADKDLKSGIQDKFFNRYAALQKTNGAAASSFDKQVANDILMSMADSLKNLTVIKNIVWVKASRSGNNWNFKLSDGRTIKPRVLVNPADAKLNAALQIVAPAKTSWNKLDYHNTMYRTNIAAGKSIDGNTASIFSLYQLLVPNQENLIWISDAQSMELGQAAGATAAYAAFFDTKTSLSNLKKIQGELVNYKLNLMPFSDVKTTDSGWKAIQFVGITGVVKGKLDGNTLKFLPDESVSTAEIKQPIKDFYYKAQIWFDDYKQASMTIGSTLDLIAYVGNKSLENTKKELAKKWKTTYALKSELDFQRTINRREFALLLQDYMPPFNVNVDKDGKVVR